MTTSVLKKTAGELMTAPPVTIGSSASLADAARLMLDHNVGCLPVVSEDGAFVGMITERAFQAELAGMRPESSMPAYERAVAHIYVNALGLPTSKEIGFEKARSGPVTEGMVADEPTVVETTEIWQVADIMLKSRLSHLAVVRDGRTVGVIARHDLLRAYAGK